MFSVNIDGLTTYCIPAWLNLLISFCLMGSLQLYAEGMKLYLTLLQHMVFKWVKDS